ncbi:MAG: Holliday junction branch migration protein RuvA [Lachnospiraceae bacterium]
MIAFITGEVVKKTESSVILATAGGIGYEVFVPTGTLANLPGKGTEIMLYTYLQVKEDGVSLFGFLREEELKIFKLLISVNGIGPKGALGILSGTTVEDLQFAVLAEDTKTIAKLPGIGPKTAGKLVLELKDKFKLEDAFESKFSIGAGELSKAADIREEAAQALSTLGYSMTEAMKVLRTLEVTEQTTVEDLLKQSLKYL